jgi:serine/threonine protein kinase
MVVDRCPETDEGISEVYKLEGELLADRYKLGTIISEGGMGVVYEAEHVKLGRRVAVKMLHPHLRVSSDTMKRFENEARLAASVGHKSVVDVLDLGRHEGLPYFVMEYLDGEGLNETLERQGTLERQEAVDMCIELLEGLYAVHIRGIIHRDLKPGNIMLVNQPGGSRIVKVLDFGISRLQESDALALNITKTGSVFGTPRYMSPEQARGQKDIDARADLYAVSVVLYRCLTGGFPFAGDNYNALLNAIATKDPIPPSERIDGIPEGLEAIIMKGLSRSPSDRYQDALAFIEALSPYSRSKPSLSASQKTLDTISSDMRPTMEGPPPEVRSFGDRSGTGTSWSQTSGRKWPGELTWLLPVGIVTVFALAGIAAVAFLLHSRMTRQQQDIERMSRVIGSKSLAEKYLPEKSAPLPPGLNRPAKPAGDETVAAITLDIVGLPSEASVNLDGRPLPQIPILLEPDEDVHVLEVQAVGYEPWQKDVALAEDVTVQVQMTPLSVAGPKKGKKAISKPPIDTTYPGMIGKKKSK